MIKYLSAIVGFYAIIKYVTWCNLSFALYAIDKSFAVPQDYSDVVNLVMYSSVCLAFIAIGKYEKDMINRFFMYYAIAEFWGLLSLQIIVYKSFPHLYVFKMYVVAFLVILVLNFIFAIYFLIKWFVQK